MKDVLIFDLGDVLVGHDIPRCIGKLRTFLGDNFSELGMKADGEGDELMCKFEKGEVGEKDFLDTIIGWCRPGTTLDDIRDAWNSMHTEIPQEKLDILKRLRDEGYSLYLLSNTNETHWNDVKARYGLDKYFDDVFLSFKEHLTKPDPELFLLAQKRIGAAAGDIVFIDDLEGNRRAAQSIGWRTCADVDELLRELH